MSDVKPACCPVCQRYKRQFMIADRGNMAAIKTQLLSELQRITEDPISEVPLYHFVRLPRAVMKRGVELRF
jgi:hypothetical protein